jgi:hypothetical protein
MKVYTCTAFKGHYPVGTSAIVVAENRSHAAHLLTLQIIANSLPEQMPLSFEDMVEVDLTICGATILNDGNY